MEIIAKLGTMLLAIGGFAALVALILLIAGSLRGPRESRNVGWLFLAPAVIGLAVAVVYPMVRTIVQSFYGSGSAAGFVGLDNYIRVLTNPDQLVVLRNTAMWVIISPITASVIGLVYATLVDRARFEALAKSLVFLPMAISLVGASIIWKFVYEYKPNSPASRRRASSTRSSCGWAASRSNGY